MFAQFDPVFQIPGYTMKLDATFLFVGVTSVVVVEDVHVLLDPRADVHLSVFSFFCFGGLCVRVFPF